MNKIKSPTCHYPTKFYYEDETISGFIEQCYMIYQCKDHFPIIINNKRPHAFCSEVIDVQIDFVGNPIKAYEVNSTVFKNE